MLSKVSRKLASLKVPRILCISLVQMTRNWPGNGGVPFRNGEVGIYCTKVVEPTKMLVLSPKIVHLKMPAQKIACIDQPPAVVRKVKQRLMLLDHLNLFLVLPTFPAQDTPEGEAEQSILQTT